MDKQTTEYQIIPISVEVANDLRSRGGEVYIADEVPGYPCRQCLRDAEVGEEMILVSYDPFESDSPYRSASPIFVHRTDCGDPDGDPSLPLQLTRRQLSVRSFDAQEMMIDAAVIDGNKLGETISEFFDTKAADRLHVHNATRGCWAATVTRLG